MFGTFAVCQDCMSMRLPFVVQRHTSAAENHFSAVNFLRHGYNHSIVKLYISCAMKNTNKYNIWTCLFVI